MPYSGGTFTNVSGATTAAPGQIVQSSVWNNIHTDYATALTEVMSQLISEITNRNALWMNGGLEVWQRGAGSAASIAVAAATNPYTADRWYLNTSANQASVVSAQAGLTNGSQLCARVQRNNAQTGTAIMTFGYPLDTDELHRLHGEKISFTATVSAGALWSPTSGTLSVGFYTGTGAPAKRGGGFTSETTVLTISTNLTPGGAAVTITGSSSVVVPTTATQGELQFTWTPVGTAGASDYFNVDDVQIESQLSASTWTPQDFDRIPFPQMLQGCKRHYQKTFAYGTAPAAGVNTLVNSLGANAIATQRLFVNWLYPVEIRDIGGVTTYIPYTGTSGNWYDFIASVSVAASIDANAIGTKGVVIYSTTSGSTTNNRCYIHAEVSAGI